jgi:uncharacterized coiled-coil protein SlyX
MDHLLLLLIYFRLGCAALPLPKTGQEMQQAIRNPGDRAHGDITGKLERVRSIIDGRFLAACEFLPQSLDGIQSLTDSLDRLTTTFDAEVMATTHAELTLAAAKLCSLPASQAKQAATIDRLNRSIEKLACHIETMRASLAFMDDFVCGRASGETATGEHVAQFYAQAAQSSAELKAFEAELCLLKRELGLAAVQGKLRNRKIAALIPALPDELTAATRLLSDRYKAVVATAEQVSAVAGRIHRRIGHLLILLQIGDITRQRIEHIQACVAQMKADAADQPEDQRRRFEATCYALIARHLAEIDEDFARQSGEIEDQMAKMADHTAQLLKLHEAAFDRGGDKAGFLHVMAQRLDTALGLVAPIEAADKSALATERAMIATAHHLGGHADRIRTLRQSLCATVSAETGTAIADKSAANCRCLDDTMHVGLAALDTLMELTGSIAAVADKDRVLDSKASSAVTALAHAAAQVHKARDITEADLGEVAAEGEAVVGTLKVNASRLCLSLEIGEVLALAALEAADLAEGAYDPAETHPEALVRTLTGFSHTYTMARERDLHRAFLAARAIPCAEPHPVHTADGVDSILF